MPHNNTTNNNNNNINNGGNNIIKNINSPNTPIATLNNNHHSLQLKFGSQKQITINQNQIQNNLNSSSNLSGMNGSSNPILSYSNSPKIVSLC